METIRFYQRKGLLTQPTPENGIRRYSSEDLRRLRFIKQAQTGGFTLQEIKELLELDASQDRNGLRECAEDRIAALDRKIAELKRARNGLQWLAQECRRGSSGECPILGIFDI